MSPQDAAIEAMETMMSHPKSREVMDMVGDLSEAMMGNEDMEVQGTALEIINKTFRHKKNYEAAQRNN